MIHCVEREIGGEKLILETGRFAEQANGAVTVRFGDTMLLVTVCMSNRPRPDIDFLPLSVDFEERLYAAGRIPGSFFRREGRPTHEAILSGRLTDRPLRPLFSKEIRNDIQVIITVLSADKINPPDVLGIIGASAAISISDIPFDGPVGACRVSHLDGSYQINPSFEQVDSGDLGMVVAGTTGTIMMVEAGATEVSEDVVLEALKVAQDTNEIIIDMINELVSTVGKPKVEIPSVKNAGLLDEVRTTFFDRISKIMEDGKDKSETNQLLAALSVEAKEVFAEQYTESAVDVAMETIQEETMRSNILDRGTRPDGRGLKEIRPISCEVGLLPRTHGSGMFKRGQTQALSVVTLGSRSMAQTLDTLSPEEKKRFMHHYNFTPYSTGEVKRVGSPGRREIGHGALAERALLPAIPSEAEFPYAIRIVSEILSSNGSTSMASVCGSTLALMDAGVPLKSPVAGVAMGLIMGESGSYAVLTDIAGMEDHLGDMDFKVAGTVTGINALQMDIKVKGIGLEILKDALGQAKEGRLFILDKMVSSIAQPREHLSAFAPKMYRMVIPVSKIGTVIGPGGRMIRSIQEETGATVDVDDEGVVILGSMDDAKISEARQRIENLTREVEIGDIFTGKVARTTNFGAFVELYPGKDGLLRNSELADGNDQPLEVGQEITVMVHEKDHMGRINLSCRALYGETGSNEGRTEGPNGQGQDRPRFRGQSRGSGQPGFRRPLPGRGSRRPPFRG